MLKKFFEIAKRAKEMVFVTTEGLYVDNKHFKMLLPLKEKVNPDYIGYISADNVKAIKPSSIKATEEVLSVQGGFITTSLNNVIKYEVDSKQKVKVKFEPIDEKCCVNIAPSFTEFIKQAAPLCANEKYDYRVELQQVCVSLDSETSGIIEIKASNGFMVYRFKTEIKNELQYVNDYGIPSAVASKLKDANIKANEKCMHIVDGSGLIIQTKPLCNYINTYNLFDYFDYHTEFEIMETQLKELQTALKSAVKGDLITLYENGSLEYIIEDKEKNVKSFGKIDIVSKSRHTNHLAKYDAVFLRNALNTYENCAVNVKSNKKSTALLLDNNYGTQNLVLPLMNCYTAEEVREMLDKLNGITVNTESVAAEEKANTEPETEKTEESVAAESVNAETETVNTTDEIKELIDKYNIRVVKGDTLKADLNGLTAKEFKETVASRKAEILAYLNPTVEF